MREFFIMEAYMKTKNKCVGCGGSLRFNPDKGGLYCENCGSVTPIDTPLFRKYKLLVNDSCPVRQEGADVSLKCESCGANLNVGEVIDTTCPYCGSHQVNCVNDGLEYIPDSIIPFAISKHKANLIFKLWIKKRKFAPNKLKKIDISSEMKGMYFPCWLYDYKTITEYQGIGVREYTDNDGNTHTTRKRISGSRPGSYVNEIEPANDMLGSFNIEQFKDYTGIAQHEYDSGYVLGFLTANNTNKVVDAFAREQKQKQVQIEEDIKTSLGYDRYENFMSRTSFFEVKWSYTLLPLWVCDYEFNKKKYRFLINGRTGSIVGKAPKSPLKILSLVSGILIGVVGVVLLSLLL